MPLAKILWLKENEPEIYEKTACFLISSKDYIIGRLTSVFAGDMDRLLHGGGHGLDKKIWSEELIGAAGVDIKKFPKLFYAHEYVGTVTETGATESGYPAGTKVYAGTGDAEQRHLPAASWHRGSTTQPRNLRLGGSRIQQKDGE